ncbi:MAG: polyribonucleotide nucleotidyltransferase [Candidatus Eisenbacteria bacterium]
MVVREEIEIGGRTFSIETGRVARQAGGAVLVQYGDTVVLVTSVISKEPKEGFNFLPLLVEYREKYYAAGKIPGGFFKREGRPTEKEILSARLIDRPVRSLFPKGFRHDVQIVASVLSSDQENDSDILAMIGASVSLGLAGAPLGGPIGVVRIGRRNGEFVLNPTFSERGEGDIDMVVVGHGGDIVMIEGGMKEISEDDLMKGIQMASEAIPQVIQLQQRLLERCGAKEMSFTPELPSPEISSEVKSAYKTRIVEAIGIPDKERRQDELDLIKKEARETLAEKYPESEGDIGDAISGIERDEVRRMISDGGKRIDGRGLREVREITCEVGVLPRTHGSALFTRGQTQALAVTTLGTSIDEQRVEDLEGESSKSYMLHYNFPPFSVGEIRPLRGPARREIGHGALAEKSIQPVIPDGEVFPYTIRLVSDILESNGSSSMATVCSGTLALMDAGVPIKAPVAGVALGLVKDGDRYSILTDILGVEDHHGDMDFKVAGTREGLTAVQMDLKIPGVPISVLKDVVAQSTEARQKIHDIMDSTLQSPREEISSYAPRIVSIRVDKDKIREIIGPGGKIIRKIIDETGAVIDINDDGEVKIASPDRSALDKALEMINAIIEDPEVGKTYNGIVKKIVDFGAFVEILPGKDGLLHISEIENRRINNVRDVLNEGDEILVKVIGAERDGKIRLSRKALLKDKDKERS